jgi:hypothetical protein
MGPDVSRVGWYGGEQAAAFEKFDDTVSRVTNRTAAVKRCDFLARESGWFPIHQMSPD